MRVKLCLSFLALAVSAISFAASEPYASCLSLAAQNCTPRERVASLSTLQVFQNICRVTIKVEQCEEHLSSDPRLKEAMRKCEAQDICEEELSGATIKERLQRLGEACNAGMTQANIDFLHEIELMAKSLVETAITNSKERAQFIQFCDAHIECKRNIAFKVPGLLDLNDQALSRYSTDDLLRRQRAYIDSVSTSSVIHRALVQERKPVELTQKREDAIAERQRQRYEAFIRNLDKMLTGWGFRPSCYSSRYRWQLRCYALFKNILDPITLATTAIGAPGVLLKLVDAASASLKAPVVTATASMAGSQATDRATRAAAGLATLAKVKEEAVGLGTLLHNLSLEMRARFLTAFESMDDAEKAAMKKDFPDLVSRGPRLCE